MSGWFLHDVGARCREGNWKVSARSLEGVIEMLGQVNLGQVKSGQVESGQVKSGQVR